ncbi:hypothetical protein N7478_009868 [Penicillium angulare]|uniref:uncharacterized protein n=1 Tax=Penicillium angulare TaxID=116970 RepID=UPI002541A49D|nr:uncharacterized protein N7478_009868 [Penicillium angulare]KAJ5267060.1 hypothetical protein N7478_009868 [Penicillium angulare]
MTSSEEIGHFRRFPDLPPEIRLMVWRECLPYRVHELDADEFYDQTRGCFPRLCGLEKTMYMNLRPPTISRVCRESRDVAFQNRVMLPYEEMLDEAYWESETRVKGMIDPSRDTVHLNWVPWDERYEDEGYSIGYLAWHAANSAQGGSMDVFAIFPDDFEMLEFIPNLVLVTRKVIVHASAEYVAKTGLFGLLCDAPVQLVDLSDENRLKAFFDLAEETQKKGYVTFGQDLHRKSCEDLQAEFKKIVKRRYGGFVAPSWDKIPPMRGAIMFRLCTDMCNNSEDAEEGFRPPPGTTYIPPPRIRGRGRGYPLGNRRPYRIRGRHRNSIIA